MTGSHVYQVSVCLSTPMFGIVNYCKIKIKINSVGKVLKILFPHQLTL